MLGGDFEVVVAGAGFAEDFSGGFGGEHSEGGDGGQGVATFSNGGTGFDRDVDSGAGANRDCYVEEETAIGGDSPGGFYAACDGFVGGAGGGEGSAECGIRSAEFGRGRRFAPCAEWRLTRRVRPTFGRLGSLRYVGGGGV